MKLYVEEQDMPQNCAECKAEGHYENSYGDEYGFFCPFGYKAYTSGTRDTKRLDNCPLVPVPPHGRTIDADALKVSLAFAEKTAGWAVLALRAVLMVIDEMPTIIQAEKSKA